MPTSSAKKGKKEIPFISKASVDKLDNPKYKLSAKEKAEAENAENLKEPVEKVKYGKIMEFDAEARKNKEKNKHEELNKNKNRKNLKLPPANKEVINANIANNTNNNAKKGAAGASKGKKQINFISQKEIENKQKLEQQAEKAKELIIKAEEAAAEKKTKNAKKSVAAAKGKNAAKQSKKTDLKAEENLATNRKLEFSDENVEKITPLLLDENETNGINKENNNNENDNVNMEKNLPENEKELINFNDDTLEENDQEEDKKKEKKTSVPKEKKPPAPKKPLKELKPVLEGDFDMIINFEDILKKEKIENSDLLLLIIEICQNALKYNLKKSNKSRLFWDEVFLKAEFAQIFKQFKSETLRKYWRVIADTQNVKAFLETTQKYAEKINNPNIK